MAYLLLDRKFIENQPKLYKDILDKICPDKIETVYPAFMGIVRHSFHSDKIPAGEVAMIRIRQVNGHYRLGAIERTDRPFVSYE